MDATEWIERRYEVVERLRVEADIELAKDRLATSDAQRVILKRATSPDSRRALSREVALFHERHHPSLRKTLAFAQGVKSSVAVFEHVEGEGLSIHLRKSPDDVLSCGVQLLRALLFLHARGKVHGDLKPENVLVTSAGKVRLIDLGLSSALGDAPVGGTPGYIPLEYASGRPVSVVGELFSFGRTMEASVSPNAAVPQVLAALMNSCTSENPSRRPASAEAALTALGYPARPVDRHGELPWVGDREAFVSARDALAQLDGRVVVVAGERGMGCTRLVGEICTEAISRHVPFADLSVEGGSDPFEQLGGVLLRRVPDDSLRAAAATALFAARSGVALIVDCGGETVWNEVMLDAARAVSIARCGALIVVGATDALTLAARRLGARVATLPSLGDDEAGKLAEAAGVRLHESVIRELVMRSRGCAGVLSRTLLAIAEHPELGTTEEALRLVDDMMSGRGTEEIGRAERCVGRYGQALDALDAFGEDITAVDRLERAQARERSGRYADAVSDANWLIEKGSAELASDASVVAAGALSSMGEAEQAAAIATRALEQARPTPRARLLAILSDAALVGGDAQEAFELAQRALEAARAVGDPLLIAHALSRVASAHALGNDPTNARTRYLEALAAVEEAGDVVAMPVFVMNVATAEHAAGELGKAIHQYEDAARLARKLGRESVRAAATTNLAGLLCEVGAFEEARRALEDAELAAEAAGSAIYAAQTRLLRAESLTSTNPSSALAHAHAALEGFRACMASRQALETELLIAEIALDRGDAVAAADFVEARSVELHEAGLAARGALLAARAASARGDNETARVQGELAVELSRGASDRRTEARSLALLADLHEQLRTGASPGYRQRALELIGQLAARLPAGLRERFLDLPEHEALRAQAVEQVSLHTLGGLDTRAKRLVSLVRRVLLEGDERRVLEAALDEAVEISQAERGFLIRRGSGRRRDAVVARNLDKDTIRQSRFRISRSVADRVMELGEPFITASAVDDPDLEGARSVADQRLRAILCVPIRGPSGVVGALYLDHRFASGRFGEGELELVGALADIIGLALENARLHREAAERQVELEQDRDRAVRETARRTAEVERLAERLSRTRPASVVEGGIVGGSPLLSSAMEVASRVAPSDLTVLIEGESGTGKELFACFIHERSRRASGPFLAINCGAVPESLLESELFGHVRGAFTGANRDHEGLFRAAKKGTLFLDEVGEMPASMQARLLRVLQESKVRPVGGTKSIVVDVRVIAATNRVLEVEVEEGRFRRDLYYRLVGVRLDLPPLRDRREDIAPLVEHALVEIAREPGMRRVRLSRDAYAALLAHNWPGNVRELFQALRRATLISDGNLIEARDLHIGPTGSSRRSALQKYDRELVIRALEAAGGNRTAAAKALGISRVTLHRWLKRYDIT